MSYCEARIAALNGNLHALQGKIDHEMDLPAPDISRLAEFKHQIIRVREDIGIQQSKRLVAV